MRTIHTTLLTAFAAAVMSLAFVACRRAPEGANSSQPGPTPATITTTSGQGTTATYQAQEEVTATPHDAKCQKPEIMSYTVSPVAINYGEKTELEWDVKGAVEVKVAGQTFRGERGKVEVDPRRWRPPGSKITGGVPFPLAAYSQEGCPPVEMTIYVTFKEGVRGAK
jgi:hypothetical protein